MSFSVLKWRDLWWIIPLVIFVAILIPFVYLYNKAKENLIITIGILLLAGIIVWVLRMAGMIMSLDI